MKPLGFYTAKFVKAQLEARVNEATKVWKAIPGAGAGRMGLTPDAVRTSPEYQAARANFDAAFKALREFNQNFTKTYATELKAERKERYK